MEDLQSNVIRKTGILVWFSACIPLLCLLVSIARLQHSWDDGAITASFAQSWAHSGHISLTPFSPECEGFSSLSWFLLLSIWPRMMAGSSGILIWMSVLSCAAFAGSLFAFYHVSLRFRYSPQRSAVATAILALAITPFHEAYNGMEMNFSMLIMLGLVALLISDLSKPCLLVGWWTLSFLFLSTRFESPYMVVMLILGCLFSLRAGRKVPQLGTLLAMSIGDLMLFAAICTWRRARFSLWMPNTVYAKLWAPYHAAPTLTGFLASRTLATAEIVIVLFGPLLALTIALFRRHGFRANDPVRTRAPFATHPLLLTLAIGAVLFGLIFGKNWGHYGRMVESFLPALILVVLDLLRSAAGSYASYKGALRLAIILHFAVWVGWTSKLLIRGDRPSIAEVATVGQGAEQIRGLLHIDRLTVLMPDVGGAGLHYPKLEILDLALLTSPSLAKTGYAGLDSYFRDHRPEVVETHGVWSHVSGIYRKRLLDGYGIVGVQKRRFFIRPDLYQKLQNSGDLHEIPVAEARDCLGDTQEDQAVSLSRGSCLVPGTITLAASLQKH